MLLAMVCIVIPPISLGLTFFRLIREVKDGK